MANEADCIDALQRAARELDDSPTKAAYDDLGLTPASATIQRVMGSWNAAKEAADLATYTSTGSRTHPKPDGVELPEDLDWESLSADQRWHYKNREWNTERSLQRRERLRSWLAAYKREEGGCRRCDATDPRTIDFHHPDPDEKELAVNEMVTMGYSKADIRAEADACFLLCANCHAKEHSCDEAGVKTATTKAERLRGWTTRYKRERGCGRCQEGDPSCLQFHHPGEKRAGVGRLISDSASESRVWTEVERCEVLCANCHRLEHHRKRAGESDRI
ncbi:hypothetical protein [Halorubellus sp. PRR65]|uniref:homing endonuclease associated repeat-containing protein n=1 Tax=Halorubellus sp. PRR65 TaxID=3098148 RepID=UPI002B25C2B5|nr:hypothetical protein [Halorubellus sp. PRR65]